MIEIFKEQFSPRMTNEEKIHRVRELLQIMALKIMYDKGSLDKLVFVGGTALRVLYDLKRFSEDLDFSLYEKKGYDFKRMMDELAAGFKLYGLNADMKVNDDKTVQAAFVKFEGLLKGLGLSPMGSQKLTIKVEVDTNPPEGAVFEKSMVNKTYFFYVPHPDLASLYAGKLSACFYRKYIKGRDFYDFIWFLARKIKPNYRLFNNAVQQTQGTPPGVDETNIKDFLLENLARVDLKQAARDVERFLEDRSELKLFDKRLLEDSIVKVFG
ncbi:MAG: nucleotidyl transferase AbiEii/AbiGii toxin family protein [Candidatus Omnitrophica bacterium]|nr:nucleotidyl transferase AbiEii/AbiGii toxin family protein [Candidatus Omnitrophota bacterium]